MLQNGTEEWDEIYAAGGADDGSAILAGWTGGSYGAMNAGGHDFVAIKINSDGNTTWQWQVRPGSVSPLIFEHNRSKGICHQFR